MDRFLVFFQRYIFSKSYVLMDLEFMILDTFDKIRPATNFRRPTNLAQASALCKQLEDFEAETLQTTCMLPNGDGCGTKNQMLSRDRARYEQLIDGIAYEGAVGEDKDANNDQARKVRKQRQKQLNKKVTDKIFDSEQEGVGSDGERTDKAGAGSDSQSDGKSKQTVSFVEDVKVSK